MRFSELHLIRYGQFDGCRLMFPRATSDLHVVYGPNEAGKSTTMAAIADLLFGFTHAAAYDFQFDKLLLRVGGVIDGAGGSLECRRKRGNVRTLLDASEQPIEEAPLTALLAGQSRDSFLRAFSLDHTRLRDGGRSMLEAKDDIGQTIFAAGSGLIGVSRLVEALEEEAKAIWSERASASRHYYVAQKAHDEARTRLRDTQLRSAHWADMKKALDSHEHELEGLRGRREALQALLQRSERRRRTLAPIARRQHLSSRIKSLGPVPDMPSNARAVLELALRQIAESETRTRLAGEQADAARKQLSQLTYDPKLLALRPAVMQLRAQQGAVDKAIRDTPGLELKAAAASSQLLRLLGEVGWPEAAARNVQARLPGRPQLSEARALLEEQRGLDGNRIAAVAELDEQSRLLSDLRHQLDARPSKVLTQTAAEGLQSLRAQGDLEAMAAAARVRHGKARSSLDVALAGLAPWRGSAAELAALPLASEAETYPRAEALLAADEDLAEAERSLADLRDERDHRQLRRSQLLRDEHAVSPEMLQTARKARDATWRQISDQLSGERRLTSPTTLHARLSGELLAADELADRRFDGAKTSAALLGLDQDLERIELALEQGERRRLAAENGLGAARASWRSVTDVLGGPVSPEGLKAWRTTRQRALELAEAERNDSDEASRLVQMLESTRKQLAAMLQPNTTEDLSAHAVATLLQVAADLEASARDHREQTVALQSRIKATEEAIERAQTRSDDADRRLQDWRGLWVAAITLLKLDVTSSLALIRAQLDVIDEIRSVSETILGYEQRIQDIGDDVTTFYARVQALAMDSNMAGSAADPFAALTIIERSLEALATRVERAEGVRTQLRDAEGREQEAKMAAELARSALSPLLAAGKVEDPAELAGLIDRAEAATQLEADIEDLTRSILELGDGFGLEQLLGEAPSGDAAEVAAESERLQDQLRTLSAEIERIAELRQAAYLQFKQADDRPDAAIAAADVAQARAEMEAQAEAYVRKRTEATLLRWTVEQFRREKQAPLLKRASAIFSELTLGRYAALRVDVEDGRPRLSAVRADGATVVPVTGLSEGTLDQLFLSLRLAAVEESVAAGVKLPFLADDLFINYDDARSAAGFRVLAKLAERTQVLFFTHHEHLANLARESVKPEVVSTCRLGELKMEAA